MNSSAECLSVRVLQPAVPSYRIGFFERLRQRVGEGFVVYASSVDLGVLTEHPARRVWERPLGPIWTILPGLLWQRGAMSIAVKRGDVVVVSGAPRYLSNIAFMMKARLKGARTIWWGHYWSSTSRPWRAGLRMLLMHFSDAIVFYTDREVDEYLASRKSSRKPVIGLNNGIETEEIVRLRKPYVPSLRPSDLLFIGRITPKAELGLLLEALALPVCAGLRLDVIGSGEEEEFLRRRCHDLGIADRVTWHGGTTDEPCIADIANACRVFVYPGSVGLSLIHGLAYGLPAIVHDDRWTHMPEIAALRVEENGTTFKRGSAASLADEIGRLLSYDKRLEMMSAAAIATTMASFNTADMAKRFCSVIETCSVRSVRC